MNPGMKKLYMVTRNSQKFKELQEILATDGFDLEMMEIDIPEQQTDNAEELIKDKVLHAFKKVQRPVLVEHTALVIEAFCNLPGLQTRSFYQAMGHCRIADYCRTQNNFKTKAITWLGYCDGRSIIIADGSVEGEIASDVGADELGFDWDKVFVPYINGIKGDKTFARMERSEKNRISMRGNAWQALKRKLNTDDKSSDYQKKIEELARNIKDKKVLLFLGAGISASMGLPDWNTLIKIMGEKLGYDGELFLTFGDYMVLAEHFKQKSRDALFQLLQEKMDLSSREDYEEELAGSEIYKMIMELDFPVIYTTNYDTLIEDYYRLNGISFDKVVEIGNMNELRDGNTRIMKFHGDIKDRDSLVLTESEYFARMDFQSFMDIQLQADLLKYHVLFLGYSLSDINVKLMLYRAQGRWGKDRCKNSYIFSVTPNQIRENVFANNGITTITGFSVDKYEGTKRFLEDLLKAVTKCSVDSYNVESEKSKIV